MPIRTAFLVACVLLFGCAAPVTTTLTAPATAVTGSKSIADLRLVLYGDDDRARVAAIAQLQKDGSPQATALLGEYFIVADQPGRVDAGVALLALDTAQARGYFRAALSDEQLTARRQAAMNAIEKNGGASIPFLQALLRDENETVRLNTVQVIQFMGGARARALLQVALDDASPAVRQAAADALVALGFMPTPSAQP